MSDREGTARDVHRQLSMYPGTRSEVRERVVSPMLDLARELVDYGYCLTKEEEEQAIRLRNSLDELYRGLV